MSCAESEASLRGEDGLAEFDEATGFSKTVCRGTSTPRASRSRTSICTAEQRMPAELEEVIVAADARHASSSCQTLATSRLDGPLRRLERAQGERLLVGRGQRAAIELGRSACSGHASSTTNGGRQHVLRQPQCELRAQRGGAETPLPLGDARRRRAACRPAILARRRRPPRARRRSTRARPRSRRLDAEAAQLELPVRCARGRRSCRPRSQRPTVAGAVQACAGIADERVGDESVSRVRSGPPEVAARERRRRRCRSRRPRPWGEAAVAVEGCGSPRWRSGRRSSGRRLPRWGSAGSVSAVTTWLSVGPLVVVQAAAWAALEQAPDRRAHAQAARRPSTCAQRQRAPVARRGLARSPAVRRRAGNRRSIALRANQRRAVPRILAAAARREHEAGAGGEVEKHLLERARRSERRELQRAGVGGSSRPVPARQRRGWRAGRAAWRRLGRPVEPGV
jgi:hypothetical protein